MNLEKKVRLLKEAPAKRQIESELARQLEYLRKIERRQQILPGESLPHGIEEYVDGESCSNSQGDFFLARQTLPFGRPYGTARIGDVATADLSPLNLFLSGQTLPPPSSIAYLDTETTGLAGGTGTCAFLIGIGTADGTAFKVHQFFLRELDEEKAALSALSETLEPYSAIITFNGKTFDIPLLETRYTLARMRSPFGRLLHLDLLHPARRVWKLRLERCDLKRLERELLKIKREGDVDGADIPQIYFDYLRTKSARGLQPVFFHNALDIVTLAALAAELSRALDELADRNDADGRDLFSLSKILERAGVSGRALAICRQAIEQGLPEHLEPDALWHLALQHKRERRYDSAVDLWLEILRRDCAYSYHACEELAIFYEHRKRDAKTALKFAEAAEAKLNFHDNPLSRVKAVAHRITRLRKKAAKQAELIGGGNDTLRG